jgi:hypothetical protein
MCMGGGSDKNLGIAAMYTAQAEYVLGQRQVALAEDKHRSDTELQREYMDLIKANRPLEERIQTAQADSMDLQLQRQRDVQFPLEDQIIKEAREYDSAERMAAEAGKADSAVVQAYDKATAGAQRDMLRSGLNPNSAKALALRENASLSQAATAANASTAAAEAVKSKGFAMRMDSAALGRNLAPNSVASADASLKAGQTQAASMSDLIQSANQSFDSTMRGFGAAGNSFGNSGSSLNALASQQRQASAQRGAGIGSMAGTAVGAYASSTAGSSAISSGLSYLGSAVASW